MRAYLALVQKTPGHSTAGMSAHDPHADTTTPREVLATMAEIMTGRPTRTRYDTRQPSKRLPEPAFHGFLCPNETHPERQRGEIPLAGVLP